jgi:hypothetical protein
MEDQRARRPDRRQNKGTYRLPLKDSDGVRVKACRRKIPDRRIGNIEAELLSEALWW